MKRIILVLIIVLTTSCSESSLFILVEEPTNKKLDNLNIDVKLDEQKLYNGNLAYSDIVPRFIQMSTKLKKGKYTLNVLINNQSFDFKIDYPKDKYVIISPYLSEEKISVSILKSDKQFVLD